MPAHTSPRRSARPPVIGMLLVALLAIFLAGSAVVPAPAAAASDLTRQISASRYSQLSYERAMRSADQQVKSLKKARKKAVRRLGKAERRLETAVDRRKRTKQHLTSSRAQLKSLRSEITTSAESPVPTAGTASALLASVPVGLPLPLWPPERAIEPDEDIGLIAASIPSGPLAAPEATPPDPTAERLAALEKQVRKDKKVYQKAKKKARKAWRKVRATRNQIASLKSRQRAAVSRREYAEAALGYRILSMSKLAQRRLAKRTEIKNVMSVGLTWPSRGRISQSYGCTGFYLNPARGSCAHFHDGIDIVSYRGSAIRAAGVGVVTYVGWNPWDQNGRAFIVVVAHPGGYETVYGHVLPTRRVRVGQLVRRGEVIGYMGNTGRSTGTHLHFELRRGRTTLNPLAYL